MVWLILLLASNILCLTLLFVLFVSYKNLQEELKYTSKNLEELHTIRSDDLSRLSHDLRTPLNAIMGYTSLLLNRVHGDITEKQAEDLERMSRSTRKILHLVENYFSETE